MVFSLATELKSALYASKYSTRKPQGACQLPASRLQHPIGSNIFLLFIIQSQFSIFWENLHIISFFLYDVFFELCLLKITQLSAKS